MNGEMRARMRDGFSLIELVLAMFLGTVGLLALGGVLASTANMQALSGSKLELMTLGESKMDELRVLSSSRTSDTTKVAVGGGLASNVTNYHDAVLSSRGRAYIRRWEVATSLNGVRRVTVRVQPTSTSRIEPAWYDITSQLIVE